MTSASLTADMIDLATPAEAEAPPVTEEAAPAPARVLMTLTTADLRFFATCYLVGLAFFLVMLS